MRRPQNKFFRFVLVFCFFSFPPSYPMSVSSLTIPVIPASLPSALLAFHACGSSGRFSGAGKFFDCCRFFFFCNSSRRFCFISAVKGIFQRPTVADKLGLPLPFSFQGLEHVQSVLCCPVPERSFLATAYAVFVLPCSPPPCCSMDIV